MISIIKIYCFFHRILTYNFLIDTIETTSRRVPNKGSHHTSIHSISDVFEAHFFVLSLIKLNFPDFYLLNTEFCRFILIFYILYGTLNFVIIPNNSILLWNIKIIFIYNYFSNLHTTVGFTRAKLVISKARSLIFFRFDSKFILSRRKAFFI